MTVPYALVLIALTAVAAQAQDQSGQENQQSQQGQQNQNEQPANQSAAPIPAYHSPFASAAANGDSEAGQVQPDTRALSGVQNLGLGGLGTSHSYWQPHVNIFESADSNAQVTPHGYSWGSWTSVSGGVDVRHISGNNDLLLSYTGGGMFSTTSGTNGGMVQQLGFTDRLALRRWTITFLDQFSYLPGAGFGFGSFVGPSLPGGIGIGGTGSPFQPGQTLFAGQDRSVANSFATEGDYALTRRTSLTLVGGYALLAYPDNDLFNFWGATARVGYNYLWTQKDTVAVFYTYSGLRYSNSEQSIDAHTVQFSYARRVTGRLAFQVAVGPQIFVSRLPLSIGGSGIPSANSTQFLWSLDTNVEYQLQRTSLNANYYHGVSSGSGALLGSIADVVYGSATRQMSRTFSSGFTAGYSRNRGVAFSAAAPASQAYNYWYVGPNLSHPWGNVGLTLSYQLQYQDSNIPFCTGATCGTSFIRHLISVGVGWHGGRMIVR
jgi:hypothetical protein